MKTTVYYHADCLDGFGAAYAAWLRFGDQAQYRPMHHGEPWNPEDITSASVFILDFSFSPETLASMAALAQEVTQVDHHATALTPWAARLNGDAKQALASFEREDGKLKLYFDLNKSGCHLAWEHFHPTQPLPPLLARIADVDLWRFQHPDSSPVCRALRLKEFDFDTWHPLVDATEESEIYQGLLRDGLAIESFFSTEVARLAQSQLRLSVSLPGECIDPLQASRHGIPFMVIGENCYRAVSGLAVNANGLFASELGNHLALQSQTFGMTWVLSGDGEVKVSLRACNRVNVATLAEFFGGGGHPNAAGFRLSATRFFREILKFPESP